MKYEPQNQFKSYCFVIMFEDNTFLNSQGYGCPFSLDTQTFSTAEEAEHWTKFNCFEDEMSYKTVAYEVVYTKVN